MDYRRMATSFSHQAAIENRAFTLTGRGDPESVGGMRVSAAAFSMLDVKPILGTVFNIDDEDPGKDHVAVISEGLWKRRFGSDPNIVGQNIQMNQESYRVLGVIHPFLEFRSAADVWVPLAFKPAEIGPAAADANRWTWSRDSSRASRSRRPTRKCRPWRRASRARIRRIIQRRSVIRSKWIRWPRRVTGDLKTPLLVLLAAVGAVMLIACANVSNLLLARAVMRRREMSIRAALGAARGRVIRQLLTRACCLAVVAGVLGMALAYAAVYSFSHFGPREIVRNPNLGINLWVMGFTMLLSLAASVIFGLAPALEASRVDLNDALKEGHTRIERRTTPAARIDGRAGSGRVAGAADRRWDSWCAASFDWSAPIPVSGPTICSPFSSRFLPRVTAIQRSSLVPAFARRKNAARCRA
jgi:putative ABC transport system permease protein